MNIKNWIILGATSIIAQEFAHIAAHAGHELLLVGRNMQQLDVLAADIRIRYHVNCKILIIDFAKDIQALLKILQHGKEEYALFIAHSLMINNQELNTQTITKLLDTNTVSTIQVIHTYLQRKQTQQHLLFLSSVAACRGRSKNSLYGASKAAIEVYLQGIQQAATRHQIITIARLGFIDTRLTYGEHGIFYASPPKSCAQACWKALRQKRRMIYHPWFWRFIMGMIIHLPFIIYKKILIGK